MVEKVAPWLTVDSDPYPAVVDGRIQWILDGYTVTDKYPLSQRESLETMTDDALQSNDTGFQTLPTDEINYLRNSVKAVVDAYDGTVTLYEWDEEDPILNAWEAVFPDVVQPRDEIPDSLMEHLRYPEDLFKAQRYQFQRYHVTDALDWFKGSGRWQVPEDPQPSNTLQPPYRLFADTGRRETWALTSVYVPRGARSSSPTWRSTATPPIRTTTARSRSRAAQREHRRPDPDRQRLRQRRGREQRAAAVHHR